MRRGSVNNLTPPEKKPARGACPETHLGHPFSPDLQGLLEAAGIHARLQRALTNPDHLAQNSDPPQERTLSQDSQGYLQIQATSSHCWSLPRTESNIPRPSLTYLPSPAPQVAKRQEDGNPPTLHIYGRSRGSILAIHRQEGSPWTHTGLLPQLTTNGQGTMYNFMCS